MKTLVKFAVKRGIPLPDVVSGTKKYDWPFETMSVGECFFVPTKDIHHANGMRSMICNAARLWRSSGKRFATRLTPGDKSIGVWRTK